MKSVVKISRFLCILCVLCGLAHALDRNAFTFTNYRLTASVDPDQQRLGVRGTITLRNDSSAPQKYISLQISSTLSWKSIQFEGKPVEFLTHTYTSDIDHTGELSEAIVTLPREVLPTQAIKLNIGYEGTIPLDTTRLTRIGVPAETARHSDWDQISPSFTAVRGIGYVVWYPVATEAASLSDGNSVEETVGRWKQRHAESSMDILFESSVDQTILSTGTPSLAAVNVPKDTVKVADFNMLRFGTNVPTFAIADYHKLSADGISSIYYLQDSQDAAKLLSNDIKTLDPVANSYHHGGAGLAILDNLDSSAKPFFSGSLLIMPFAARSQGETNLTLIYALIHAGTRYRYAWVQEGLAHYAQAAYLEQKNGRQAALDYLNAHESELVEAEKTTKASPRRDDDSLLNAIDDIPFQSKALRVWWMLHDMLGANISISAIMRDYNFSEDQSPDYIQKLIEGKTHRDLQWFFDDWVYHDRGLPDFRVTSVFSSPMASGGNLVTVTVQNLGKAGAEVPIILEIAGGKATHRLKVPANAKASIRFEVPAAPERVTVNDGSVPESDMSNNSYVIAK